MNENSPQTLSIKDWLDDATRQLVFAGIPTARLDSELILAHSLRQPRSYLHAHDEDMLDERAQEIATARLELRLDRVPVAYIIGHKEFYGRRFKVTPSTLIPRPESEALIELLSQAVPRNALLIQDQPLRLVDVGTGSGALGITAKLAYPELHTTLIDIDKHTLSVAEHNAKTHGASVDTLRSDLLSSYAYEPHIIIANLPYVDPTWERSEETRHEPAHALFADNGGKALIFKLLSQAKLRLPHGGFIVLEADPTQHEDIIKEAKKNGLLLQDTLDYGLLFQKIA